ncbi:hypothetical protein SHIRM173S_13267 [Streptomyces hirsutus]
MRVEDCYQAFTLRYIRAVQQAIRAAHGLLMGNSGTTTSAGRQETAPQMSERPAQRTPNRQLAALIAEAGFSNADSPVAWTSSVWNTGST